MVTPFTSFPRSAWERNSLTLRCRRIANQLGILVPAMPRFVILQHEHPQGRHYDFMLEFGDALKTWSLADPPAAGIEQIAKLLPDHRIAYLDYEGPVSRDRGTVMQWDRGTYRLVEQTNESMIVELFGERIRGRAILALEPGGPTCWKCRFADSEKTPF